MSDTSRTIDMRMSKAESLRLSLYTSRKADGANPSQFLENLEVVLYERIWEELGISFIELLEESYPTGVGLSREDVKALIKLHHKHEDQTEEVHQRMEAVRTKVRRLLNPALAEPGEIGNGRGESRGSNTTSTTQERGSDYTLSRLRRDRPDLAERVLDGSLSANAAAIEAGFRKRSLTVSSDLTKAAKKLSEHFDPDELYRAMKEIR